MEKHKRRMRLRGTFLSWDQDSFDCRNKLSKSAFRSLMAHFAYDGDVLGYRSQRNPHTIMETCRHAALKLPDPIAAHRFYVRTILNYRGDTK